MVLLDELEAQQEEAQSQSGGGRTNSLAQPGGGGRATGETVTYVNEGDSD